MARGLYKFLVNHRGAQAWWGAAPLALSFEGFGVKGTGFSCPYSVLSLYPYFFLWGRVA